MTEALDAVVGDQTAALFDPGDFSPAERKRIAARVEAIVRSRDRLLEALAEALEAEQAAAFEIARMFAEQEAPFAAVNEQEAALGQEAALELARKCAWKLARMRRMEDAP